MKAILGLICYFPWLFFPGLFLVIECIIVDWAGDWAKRHFGHGGGHKIMFDRLALIQKPTGPKGMQKKMGFPRFQDALYLFLGMDYCIP